MTGHVRSALNQRPSVVGGLRAQLLLVHLAARCDADGVLWIRAIDLATPLDASPRTVQRMMRALIVRGFIHVEARTRRGNLTFVLVPPQDDRGRDPYEDVRRHSSVAKALAPALKRGSLKRLDGLCALSEFMIGLQPDSEAQARRRPSHATGSRRRS